MDISKQLEQDHAALHTQGRALLEPSGAAGIGRDEQFDRFDTLVRRHLAVTEEVFVRPARSGANATAAADLLTEHKLLRTHLAALDRPDKESPAWATEFQHFLDHLERVCHQHGRLSTAESRPDHLRLYSEAKQSRTSGGWNWNKVGIGVAGAAAVAGAALAANYFSSGRRKSGRSEDDFELRLETDETLRLISSTKVEGTPVVGREGEALGTIVNFMVDKYSGRVAYAVMKIKGTSGLFPLPWPLLDYDVAKDGYALDVSAEELANAPSFKENDEPEFDADYRRSILVFYRPQPSGSFAGSTAGTGSAMNFGGSANSASAPSVTPAM